MLKNDKAVITSRFGASQHTAHFIDVIRDIRIPADHWLRNVAIMDVDILADFMDAKVPRSKRRMVGLVVG